MRIRDEGFKTPDPNDIKTFPPPFDLVQLLLDDERIITGWHGGARTFTGYRLNQSCKVVAWRKVHGLY